MVNQLTIMIALTDRIETVYGESDITATNAQIKNIQLKNTILYFVHTAIKSIMLKMSMLTLSHDLFSSTLTAYTFSYTFH